jgi:hypothetical protein
MALPYITLGAYCLPAYSVTPFWAAAHLYVCVCGSASLVWSLKVGMEKIFHILVFQMAFFKKYLTLLLLCVLAWCVFVCVCVCV